MSFIAVNWVMRLQVGDPIAKFVLYQLADMANDDGIAFPTVEMIARRTELHEATVRRALRRLVEMGLVAVSPSPGRRSNTYHLVMNDSLAEREGSAQSTLAQCEGSDSQPSQSATRTLAERDPNPRRERAMSAPSPPSTPLSHGEPPSNHHGKQGGCGGDFDPIGFVRASYRQHGFTRPSNGAVEAEARAVMALFHAGVTVGELRELSRRIFEEGERVIRQQIRVFRYLREHLPQQRDKLRRLPPQGVPSYFRVVSVPPDWGGLQ